MSDLVEKRQRILRAIGDTSARTDELFLDSLFDDDPLVRDWAIEGLLRRPTGGAESVDLLIGMLNEDPKADHRAFAARALSRLGVGSYEVREALLDALGDEDGGVRCFSALGLCRLRIVDVEVVASLRDPLAQTEGTKLNLEDQSIGVALARLHTVPQVTRPPGRPAAEFEPEYPAETPLEELPSLGDRLTGALRQIVVGIVADRAGISIELTLSSTQAARLAREYTIKERLVARRGPHCQICNATFEQLGGLWYYECHHIVRPHEGGSDEDDNLIVVCPNHHRQLHVADVFYLPSAESPQQVVINGLSIPIRRTEAPRQVA